MRNLVKFSLNRHKYKRLYNSKNIQVRSLRRLALFSYFLQPHTRINWYIVGGTLLLIGSCHLIYTGYQFGGGLTISRLQENLRLIEILRRDAAIHPCNLIVDVLTFDNFALIDAAKLTRFYNIPIDDSIRIVHYAIATNNYIQIDNLISDRSLIETFQVTQEQLQSDGLLRELRAHLMLYNDNLGHIIPGELFNRHDAFIEKVANLSPIRHIR